jgi:hypothetical protein
MAFGSAPAPKAESSLVTAERLATSASQGSGAPEQSGNPWSAIERKKRGAVSRAPVVHQMNGVASVLLSRCPR